MTSESTLREPLFGCDCVAMKKKIQARIYEETKHMTWEEEREHIRKGAEEFNRKIERIRTEIAAQAQK